MGQGEQSHLSGSLGRVGGIYLAVMYGILATFRLCFKGFVSISSCDSTGTTEAAGSLGFRIQ